MSDILAWLKPVTDFLKEQAPLLIPGAAGVTVTVLTSEKHSWKSAIARVGAGLFCSVVFTDALLSELGRDPETYRTPVSALLAMTGFQIVRSFTTMDVQKIAEAIKTFRGGR